MFYRPLSDLHREFDRFYKGKNSNLEIFEPSHLDTDKDTILGLAGDIDVKKNIFPFLVKMSKRFHSVILVLGNHDYWKRDFSTFSNTLKSQLIEHGITNVFVLDRDSVEICGVTFIGATLWTDYKGGDYFVMDSAKRSMNDFKFMRSNNYSRRVTPEFILSNHLADKKFIFDFANDDKKMVVISHHAPSFQSESHYEYNPIQSHWYFTELGNEISYSNFKLWHHGHLHSSSDYLIHETRVICNPRGYFHRATYGDTLNPRFDQEKLINLDLL